MNTRLEVADSQFHEAVLAGIVQVLVDCVRHPAGGGLSADHHLRILKACFNISAAGPPEPSELLQQTAKQAIQTIVQVMFTRLLVSLAAKDEADSSSSGCRPDPAVPAPEAFADVLRFACKMVACDSAADLLAEYGYVESGLGPGSTVKLFRVRLLGLSLAYTILITLQTHLASSPACRPLLAVATDDLARGLLKIARQRTPNVVVFQMMLATLHLLVLYASPHLQMQLLSFIVAGHLMPYTARLTAPPRSPITPSSPSSLGKAIWEITDEHAEMLMESLIEWCGDPGFLPYLYWHYDCNTACPNVYELLCRFLASGAATAGVYARHLSADDSFEMPGHAAAGSPKQPLGMPALRHLSLNCLLSMLRALAARCGDPAANPCPVACDTAVLRHRKRVKELLHHVAKLFAEKPKRAVEFLAAREDPETAKTLVELGLPSNFHGEQLGQFIWRHRSLFDKEELGAYVSEPGRNPEGMPQESDKLSPEEYEKLRWKAGTTPFHEGVLKGYLGAFNFKQIDLLTALRKLLNSFKLPGEAQKIDRIVLAFSTHWIASNADAPPGADGAAFNPFVDADGCYVFCFSIIMLTTDRHSSQIQEKDKISFEGWRANNRGINGGKDVPEAFQRKVYDDICATQIQMRDPIFEAWDDTFVWHEILQESEELHRQSLEDQRAGLVPLVAFNSTDPRLGFLDATLFEGLWRSALTAFCGVLQTYDDTSFQGTAMVGEEEEEVEEATTGGLLGTAAGGASAHALVGGSKAEGVLRQAVQGCVLAAKVAQHHALGQALDHIVLALTRFAAPALSVVADLPGGGPRGATVITQRQQIVHRFGRSARALLACQAVFAIARTCGTAQRDSWKCVVQLFVTLFLLELLPEQQDVVGDEDEELAFLAPRNASPILHRRPSQEKSKQRRSVDSEEAAGAGGWFSIFGGGRTDRSKVDEKQFQQSQSQALACAQAARISDLLYVASRRLAPAALVALAQAVILGSSVPLNTSTLLPPASPSSPASSSWGDGASPKRGDPPADPAGGVAGGTPNPQIDAFTTGLCLHVLVDICVANRERFPLLAPYLEHYAAILLYSVRVACGVDGDTPFRYPQDRASQMALQYWTVTGENVVLALLRLLVRLIGTAALHPPLFKTLSLLDALSPTLFSTLVAEHYVNALYVLLKGKLFAHVRGRDHWELLLSLAHKSGAFSRRRDSHLRRMTFHLISCITTLGQFGWPDNVPTVVSALTSLYSRLLAEQTNGPEERPPPGQDETDEDDGDDDWVRIPAYGARSRTPQRPDDTEVPLKVVDLLHSLHHRLLASAPSLAAPSPAWVRAWFAVLSGLAGVVTQGAVAREEADGLVALQGCVLAPPMASLAPAKAMELFVTLLMPLLDKSFSATAGAASESPSPGGFRLLGFLVFSPEQPKEPAARALSPAAVEDLQGRTLALVSQAFLHYLRPLSRCPQDFPTLWRQILAAFGSFCKQRPTAERRAAVKENIRNVVQVMVNCAGAERKDLPEDQQVFGAYPRFWTETMDELGKHFDFAEQLNEYIRGALSVSTQRTFPSDLSPLAASPNRPLSAAAAGGPAGAALDGMSPSSRHRAPAHFGAPSQAPAPDGGRPPAHGQGPAIFSQQPPSHTKPHPHSQPLPHHQHPQHHPQHLSPPFHQHHHHHHQHPHPHQFHAHPPNPPSQPPTGLLHPPTHTSVSLPAPSLATQFPAALTTPPSDVRPPPNPASSLQPSPPAAPTPPSAEEKLVPRAEPQPPASSGPFALPPLPQFAPIPVLPPLPPLPSQTMAFTVPFGLPAGGPGGPSASSPEQGSALRPQVSFAAGLPMGALPPEGGAALPAPSAFRPAAPAAFAPPPQPSPYPASPPPTAVSLLVFAKAGLGPLPSLLPTAPAPPAPPGLPPAAGPSAAPAPAAASPGIPPTGSEAVHLIEQRNPVGPSMVLEATHFGGS
eukprot:EG_transcript_103